MKGRHALVTGGSRGIGRGIAAALVAAGATVTVLGRDRSALERAVGEGAAHAAAVGDVTDGAAIQAVIAKAESRNGPIDLLVANAGQAVSAPFAKSDEALFARMIDVNLMGVVHASRAVLDGMTGRGFGRIVAIASTAGLKGYPYVTAYCAAKHAVVGFVRALAAETAATGVTVNAVCPGFADTDLTRESIDRIVAKTGRSREEALAELVRHNPQKRLVTPEEVAHAVVWLCGGGAGAVTGQAIAVAGGEV
jgi:NAD(P)-dependent dehydrogenase (short-subunit alcohol dehydrogenase family)